ncbi:MAG TPA: site-specific integrase [Methylobacter sp.]|jgi:integrase
MANITERTLKDGSKRYTVIIRIKGCESRTETFRRLTDAKKWIAKTESEIRDGKQLIPRAALKKTLGDAIDRYINEVLPEKPALQADQTTQLNWFKAELGNTPLANITTPLIVQCRDKLNTEMGQRGKVRSPATVTRFLAALSSMFSHCISEWEWTQDNPVKRVKKPKVSNDRVRFLDNDERQRFLKVCQESSNKQLYLCVILAMSTGMRQAELMELTWKDVDIKAGFLLLNKTKNGEKRRVPLSGHGLELLREHAKLRRLDTPLLFPGKKDPLNPIDLRRPFENAVKLAEIEDFHWHDLRHCCASYLLMNGASLPEIAKILGHKTLAMVMRYSHMSNDHASGIVASMNAKIFGGV